MSSWRLSASSSSTVNGDGSLSPESTLSSFKKLFTSVADPQTANNHQRHHALAKNVLYRHELGWKLGELPVVNDFLLLLREKILDGATQFIDQLLQAVIMCGKPFVRQKTNEEILNPTLLHGILPTLGELLSFHVVEIQVAAAEALREFAMGTCLSRTVKPRSNNADGSMDDLRLPPRAFSQNLMEETGTVDAIVAVMHDLFPDEEDPHASELQVAEETGDTARSDANINTENPITFSADEKEKNGGSRQESTTQLNDVSDEPTKQIRLQVLLFPLVDLIYELSNHQRCAEVLVVTGALHYIVFILENITNTQDELLPLCLVILWNVLELCQEKVKTMTRCATRKELLVHFRLHNATFFLSNEFTFHTLLHVLELLLTRGYRQQDKEMRNECLMILQLLAKRRRSLEYFYSTGLTACLYSYATAAEVNHRMNSSQKIQQTPTSSSTSGAITANFHHYATNSEEDFEFKQMLWYLLAEISCDHEANLRELVQFRFLEILLVYATGSSQSPSASLKRGASFNVQQYTSPQLQILQTTALNVLNHVTPFVLDHFYEIQGHKTILEFLQIGVATNDDMLTSAWLLMVQISPSIPFFQEELRKIDAIETALTAFATPPSRHTFASRRNALLACSNMCRNHEANKKTFQQINGVHFLLQHLEYDPSHAVLEEHILIAIIDAVRSCVFGNSDSELAFIAEDGVLKLLSILSVAPKAIKHQVLAALAEICVNPAAIPSFLAWRSSHKDSNNATAHQVLLRIYAKEETAEERQQSKLASEAYIMKGSTDIVAATNTRQSAFRSIATCQGPFIITTSAADEETPEVSSSPQTVRPDSPAFARLKEALKAAQNISIDTKTKRKSLLELQDAEIHPELNLKAKIYAVLANLSFACDIDTLEPHEQVVLEIAKEYPAFQLGEMWQNIEVALHAEGVRPVYADALYIRKHIEHAYNVSICTKHAQNDVLFRMQEHLTSQEQAFFQQILLQKDQEAQAEAFHRANRLQNSTMKLHLDAKKTQLEFMRKQDPAAFAAYESQERYRIEDPPPECIDDEMGSLQQKEEELRGRLSTISTRK